MAPLLRRLFPFLVPFLLFTASALHHHPPESATGDHTPRGSKTTRHGDSALRAPRTRLEADESRFLLALDRIKAAVAVAAAADYPTFLVAPQDPPPPQNPPPLTGSRGLAVRSFLRLQTMTNGSATGTRAPSLGDTTVTATPPFHVRLSGERPQNLRLSLHTYSAVDLVSSNGEEVLEEAEQVYCAEAEIPMEVALSNAHSPPLARWPAGTIAIATDPVVYVQALRGWCSSRRFFMEYLGFDPYSKLAASPLYGNVSTAQQAPVGIRRLAPCSNVCVDSSRAARTAPNSGARKGERLTIRNGYRNVELTAFVTQVHFVELGQIDGYGAGDNASSRKHRVDAISVPGILWAVGPVFCLLFFGVISTSWFVRNVETDENIRLCDSCRNLPHSGLLLAAGCVCAVNVWRMST